MAKSKPYTNRKTCKSETELIVDRHVEPKQVFSQQMRWFRFRKLKKKLLSIHAENVGFCFFADIIGQMLFTILGW